MKIHCAIGERGAAHAVDDALMELIDIATIACGAHAGDEKSIAYYHDLAKEHGVKAAALLSYPRLDNVEEADKQRLLMESLDQQAAAFGKMGCVRFQGALYNHLNRAVDLAENVVAWLKAQGVEEVIAPHKSMLHKVCIQEKIPVIYEAYGDREYSSMQLGLELMSRDQLGPAIKNTDDIVRQVRKMKQGVVEIEGYNYLMEVESVCLDSQSPQALEHVQAVRNIL